MSSYCCCDGACAAVPSALGVTEPAYVDIKVNIKLQEKLAANVIILTLLQFHLIQHI